MVKKQIKGFPKYFVIDNGAVISIARGKEKILIPHSTNAGYHRVQLYLDGKLTRKSVHRIVAEAFILNPENKPCVNHKDGNKINNCVDNLEWCTRSENIQHAIANNLFPPDLNRGEKSGNAKLTEKDVIEIRRLKGIMAASKIADKFGVHINTIAIIWARKSWKWL